MADADAVASRLASRTILDVQTGCVLWCGGTSGSGYGTISVHGRPVATHRLAYLIAHGSIPRGAMILHSCDVRRCVNPDHLRAGDYVANVADAVARKRHSEARKTECIHGHPFDEANTYRLNRNRYCRACNKAAVARFKAKKRGARP